MNVSKIKLLAATVLATFGLILFFMPTHAAGNFAWVAASLWVAFGAGLPLTALGLGWVLAQALVVLVMAELEWAGARRARGLAMA